MASPSYRRDLKALYRLINQADLVLDTIPDPDSSVVSARESLTAALVLSKDLATRSEPLKDGAAATLGAKGGTKTAERGAEYFKQIAAMRTNRKGGRPRKTA